MSQASDNSNLVFDFLFLLSDSHVSTRNDVTGSENKGESHQGITMQQKYGHQEKPGSWHVLRSGKLRSIVCHRWVGRRRSFVLSIAQNPVQL